METQRQAFLEEIQADLSSSSSSLPVGSELDVRPSQNRRAKHVVKRMMGAGALVAVSAAVLSLSVGTAQAATVSDESRSVHILACSTPDAIPQSQSKWCGTANYVFDYQYFSAGCYYFDLWIYNAPCGGTVHVGEKYACVV